MCVKPGKNVIVIFLLLAFALLCVLRSAAAPGGTALEKVLYAFNGGADGLSPSSNLILDTVGNLYGTTHNGGDYECDGNFGCGTVFQLQPGRDGNWSKRILHTFHGQEGAYPNGVVFDSAGNLYGTAVAGGGAQGFGVVFKLAPTGSGEWEETVLHIFTGADGRLPGASLIFDSAGNLYGTTQTGGNLSACSGYGCGTVFKLAPVANGKWAIEVLHTFNGNDGSDPTCSLLLQPPGTLYGTASSGGAFTYGSVFALTQDEKGKWREAVLHSFDGKDGAIPSSGLVVDYNGSLYGTAQMGGNLKSFCAYAECGTVFELTLGMNSKWTMSMIHVFDGIDGMFPYSGLTLDTAGNLYGTTYYSGRNVFKLSRSTSGTWIETVLHQFMGADGWTPTGGLVFDSVGNLYGTTQDGGNPGNCESELGNGCGVVYEITP